MRTKTQTSGAPMLELSLCSAGELDSLIPLNYNFVPSGSWEAR
jgi:hypothetical protein